MWNFGVCVGVEGVGCVGWVCGVCVCEDVGCVWVRVCVRGGM